MSTTARKPFALRLAAGARKFPAALLTRRSSLPLAAAASPIAASSAAKSRTSAG